MTERAGTAAQLRRLCEAAIAEKGSRWTPEHRRRLVGRPHYIAAHPGGMVIGRRPLVELLPLEVAPKGVVGPGYEEDIMLLLSRVGDFRWAGNL